MQRISEVLVNDGEQQRVFYLPGVGTDSLVDQVVGGVLGSGIQARVREDTASFVKTITRTTTSR